MDVLRDEGGGGLGEGGCCCVIIPLMVPATDEGQGRRRWTGMGGGGDIARR